MPEPTVADRREALEQRRQALVAWLEMCLAEAELPVSETAQADWMAIARRLRVAADQAERLAAETGRE